jgi:PIN domain nuclease of toxin-antitoxin system
MLLLDTCAMIWLADGGSAFPKRVVKALRAHARALQVCAISAFEIAILYRKGRIELPEPPDRWYESVRRHHGLDELPITGRIAARAAMLPLLHKDPCDRMIVAAALESNLRIVTADLTLADYPGVKIVWK